MPAWLVALASNRWVRLIFGWIMKRVRVIIIDHVTAYFDRQKQNAKDEKNAEEYRESTGGKLPLEERRKRGTDLLNGD